MKCKWTPVLLSLALAGTLAVPVLAVDGNDTPAAAQQLLVAEKPDDDGHTAIRSK